MNTEKIFNNIRKQFSNTYYNTDYSILEKGDSINLLKKYQITVLR